MKFGNFTLARRMVALSILALFFSQLFRVKWLIGGITGSLAFRWLNLLDVFAFAESTLSAHSFTLILFYSVLPVLILYLMLGRAFCGWICPLDLVFQAIARIKKSPPPTFSISEEGGRKGGQALGYLISCGLLMSAALFQVPFFTSYLSPLTNFYRLLYAGFFWAGGYPAEFRVLAVSGLILGGFLILEFFRPRLFCRLFCPVGKTYGLFNRVNFLHVKMAEGACTGCRQCEQACYMGVKILSASPKKIQDPSCILCGRCVEACPDHENILKMEFGK